MRMRLCAASVGLLFLANVLGAAEEPASRTKKFIGTWERGFGEAKVTFQFKADQLRAKIVLGDASIEIEADYGVTRDDTVFGIVTKVTKNGTGDGPSEGELFRFKFTPDKKTATLSDLKPGDEEAKKLLEGEYKRAAD